VLREPFAQPGLGQRAGKLRHDGTVMEEAHVRDAADAELLRELGVAFGVDLHEPPAAGGLGGEFLEHGAEHLAGAAPRGPEVDQHRHGLAGGGHVLREILKVVVHREGKGGWPGGRAGAGRDPGSQR
jgi:hypothetical protein